MNLNIGGIILHKILENPKDETSLEAWGRLKLNFFTSEYRSIYSYISTFYNKNSTLPSFEEIKIVNRNSLLASNIRALEKLKIDDDIDIFVACDALLNEYTQNQALKRIDSFIDNITFLDSEEIKSELNNISLELEEETFDSQHVVRANNIMLANKEEIQGERIYLGINNSFDAEVMLKTSEYIMLGGYRGSGKSIVSLNAAINQYLQKNVSIYFTIEMSAEEIFQREMSILSQVDYLRIRQGNLSESEYDKLAVVRKDMFEDSEDIYQDYLKDKNFRKFEQNLITEKRLAESQIIIVDNRRLTMTDIDINIQKVKSRFPDRLKLVVVDYVNQIWAKDQYDWKEQIALSAQLKLLSRKYDVAILSPYQIDKKGEARFSKGVLDSPDISVILTANKDHINFESTKTRGTPPFNYNSGMNWSTVTIDPVEFVVIEDNEEDDREQPRRKQKNGEEDLPF